MIVTIHAFITKCCKKTAVTEGFAQELVSTGSLKSGIVHNAVADP